MLEMDEYDTHVKNVNGYHLRDTCRARLRGSSIVHRVYESEGELDTAYTFCLADTKAKYPSIRFTKAMVTCIECLHREIHPEDL